MEKFSEFAGIPHETTRSILHGKSRDCKVSTIIAIMRSTHMLFEEMFELLPAEDIFVIKHYLSLDDDNRNRIYKEIKNNENLI